MEARFLVVVLIAFVVASDAVLPPHKCKRTWKKIGCFTDRVFPAPRPLDKELVNIRDPTNPAWNSYILQWNPPQFAASLHALACECNRLTKEKGYRYFGLQFFGECWSGDSLNFARDGTSTDCINIVEGDYKPCDLESDGDQECVGKAFTNYIYDTQGDVDDDTPVPGDWGEWFNWAHCSASCGGGTRTRERFCDNPEPSNGGADCVGEPEAEEACNEEECQEICTRKMEVGVALDDSSSITYHNYKNVMLPWAVNLTEKFDVSADGTHFGFLRFSDRVKLDFRINDEIYWNKDALKDKIKNIKYTYGGTNIEKALGYSQRNLFCCGRLRPGIPKVLIVVTDGESTALGRYKLPNTAQLLKEMGVTIIAIGIGKVNKDELEIVATSPSHVFLIDKFNYLVDHLNAISKKVCEETEPDVTK